MELVREVMAPGDGELPLPEKAAVFDQVSRTVRLAQFLGEKARSSPGAKAGQVRGSAVREPAPVDERALEERREAWCSYVDRYVGGMEDEMLDRLDAPDVLDGIDRGQPIDAVIVEIRRDLGLSAGWRPLVTLTTQEARAAIDTCRAAGRSDKWAGGAADVPGGDPRRAAADTS